MDNQQLELTEVVGIVVDTTLAAITVSDTTSQQDAEGNTEEKQNEL